MNTSVYPTIKIEESAKSRFIKKTYFHLVAAIATFALLETLFFQQASLNRFLRSCPT